MNTRRDTRPKPPYIFIQEGDVKEEDTDLEGFIKMWINPMWEIVHHLTLTEGDIWKPIPRDTPPDLEMVTMSLVIRNGTERRTPRH